MHETVGDAALVAQLAPDETSSQTSPTHSAESRLGSSMEAHITKVRALTGIGLMLLVLLAFANSLSGDFVQDDIPQVKDSPMAGGFTASNIRRAFSRDFWANIEPEKAIDRTDSVYYRPVFLLALMAGQKLAGTNARRWHILTISLHALTVLLVFMAIGAAMNAIVARPASSKHQFLAAIGAAVFAVHPAQSESVAWISGLVGPLSTAFMIAAFLCYLSYRQSGRDVALLAMAILFAVAALTKENTLALLLIIPVCEVALFRSEPFPGLRTRRARVILVLVLIASLYMLARFRVLGFFFGSNLNLNFPDDSALGVADVIRTVPALIAQYARIIVFPNKLSFMYGFSYVRELSLLDFWLPVFAIAVALAGLALWARRVPEVRLGAIFLLIPLLPHLNTRAFVSDEIIHDRYLYVPLIGAGVLFGAFLLQVTRVTALRAGAACSAVALLIVVTVAQNRQWSNAESLWARASQTAPGSRLVHISLGALAEERRDSAAALAEYETALKSNPDVIDALNNAAFTSARMGDWRSAVGRFERIAELTPDKAIAHFNLSFSYAVLKRYDDAAGEQRRALELDPNGPRSAEWRGRLEQLELVRAQSRGDHGSRD